MAGQTSGDDLPIRLWNHLRNNQEVAAIQDYANMVSIRRLGLNDHGPVHMKTVCRNALKMLSILHSAGMQTSLEKENIGTFADSVAAVMLASLLHDCGMTIGRNGHERPLKIEIHMRAEVGFFQVEEVLIPKIQSSPAKSLLELYAGVEGEEMKRYM